MSTTIVILLGILVWILLAIGLAVLLGRMIRLRERHAPPTSDAPSQSPNGDPGTYSQPQRDPDRDGGD